MSLFTTKRVVTATFPDGIFCLAGANGLGKSTFLAALNFGLTGRVPDPERKFESVREYFEDSFPFAESFFDGRVRDRDRETAEVDLDFTVGIHRYRITRCLFEPAALRKLSITDITDAKRSLIDLTALSDDERHERYAEMLTSDIGLATFDQFVFLQLFVFTFDERRHLLFWDARVLEQVLYLTFGIDPKESRRADTLKREGEKLDSLARNANWQAAETRKRISELRQLAEDPDPAKDEGVEAQYQNLLDAHKAAREAVERDELQLRDCHVKMATLSASQVALRKEYAGIFAKRIPLQYPLRQHPVVQSSLAEDRCGVCGTAGGEVKKTIEARAVSTRCFLCDSILSIQAPQDKPKIEELQRIDQELVNAKGELEEQAKRLERLTKNLDDVRARYASAFEELTAFEAENKTVIAKLREQTTGKDVSAIIDSLRAAMDESLAKKESYYARRDEKRRELKRLHNQLEERYAEAETRFVPQFTELAHRFLGLDLSITFESRVSSGPTLLLEVRSARRREPHQLSESQRFFVDIALRMAICQFIADPAYNSCIFLDTPEGSLDLAYEKRAGDMLAMHVTKSHRLIMTANINSSRLLRELATQCGAERMELLRMTAWTELSDVQAEQEDAFDKAFGEIEEALKSKRKEKKRK